MKLRVVLNSIRILNDRDPAMASLRFGEAKRGVRAADNRMVLDVEVSTQDDGGPGQRTRLPEDDHGRTYERKFYRPYSLYSLRVGVPIFEGDVSGSLDMRIDVVAPQHDRSQTLSTFARQWTGDPTSWLGSYHPRGIEGLEHVGFWQVFYNIEAA